jgi:hypothetical protein
MLLALGLGMSPGSLARPLATLRHGTAAARRAELAAPMALA